MAQSKAPPFTLYEYRASPFCVAVRIGLNEVEAAFTPRDVDLDKPRTAAFLKRSPFGRLPALVEHRPGGELAIFESPAILLFLAERFEKSPIGFIDLSSKAQALSWISYMATGFGEQIWKALIEKHMHSEVGHQTTRFSEEFAELERQVDVLDKHLARRAFLAGDYTVADTLATPLLDMLEKIPELDMDGFPHVASWRERLRSRQSYKNAWPQVREAK